MKSCGTQLALRKTELMDFNTPIDNQKEYFKMIMGWVMSEPAEQQVEPVGRDRQ
jgi:hypothetical protein